MNVYLNIITFEFTQHNNSFQYIQFIHILYTAEHTPRKQRTLFVNLHAIKHNAFAIFNWSNRNKIILTENKNNRRMINTA